MRYKGQSLLYAFLANNAEEAKRKLIEKITASGVTVDASQISEPAAIEDIFGPGATIADIRGKGNEVEDWGDGSATSPIDSDYGGTGTTIGDPMKDPSKPPSEPARSGFKWEFDSTLGQWVEKSVTNINLDGQGGTIGGRDVESRQAFNSDYLAAAPGSASPFDRYYRSNRDKAGDIYDVQAALGLTSDTPGGYLNSLTNRAGGIAGSIAGTAGDAWDTLMEQFRGTKPKSAPAEGLGLYDANPDAEVFNLASSVAQNAARRKYGSRAASFLRGGDDLRQRYLAQEPGASGSLDEYLNFISKSYGF